MVKKFMSTYQILLTTCPDQATAHNIAKSLLEQNLVACVNIVPQIQSLYVWRDEIVSDNEVLLLIKTTTKSYADIEKLILQLHPYELPELIAIAITQGLPGYLNWLSSSTAKYNEEDA
jgi:periplasmic divalent cation tolerance protein